MADDLAQLLFATGLSRKTSAISKQNLLLSLGIVAVLIPATVLGLGIGPTVAIHEQDFFREVEGRRARPSSRTVPRRTPATPVATTAVAIRAAASAAAAASSAISSTSTERRQAPQQAAARAEGRTRARGGPPRLPHDGEPAALTGQPTRSESSAHGVGSHGSAAQPRGRGGVARGGPTVSCPRSSR
jgi:hypothetical protein